MLIVPSMPAHNSEERAVASPAALYWNPNSPPGVSDPTRLN